MCGGCLGGQQKSCTTAAQGQCQSEPERKQLSLFSATWAVFCSGSSDALSYLQNTSRWKNRYFFNTKILGPFKCGISICMIFKNSKGGVNLIFFPFLSQNTPVEECVSTCWGNFFIKFVEWRWHGIMYLFSFLRVCRKLSLQLFCSEIFLKYPDQKVLI